MTPVGTPYLSVVATARNDNHGGDLLGRMQTFVNSWIGQCQKHGLASELILVDWNPPQDKPPLIDALQWPPSTAPCTVRFIQVPPEIHRRYQHADAMPLYQMIAKNVGIRRSRGRFVLATNIDILFSDELVRFLAEGRLEPGHLYRIDRHDVMSEVPVHGSVEEQLTYCENHLIRVNTREGTFNLTPDGRRALSDPDIAGRDSGISFGPGWFATEHDPLRGTFRWMSNDAEVSITSRPSSSSALILDLEPGPSAGTEPVQVQALDIDGRLLGELTLRTRAEVELDLSLGDDIIRDFRLRILGQDLPVPYDPRVLNLRAFRCDWAPAVRAAGGSRLRYKSAGIAYRIFSFWAAVVLSIRRVAAEKSGAPLVNRRLAQMFVRAGGVRGLLTGGPRHSDPSAFVAASELPPVLLHTNACGDFTMMAREHWFDIRGYAEFDMYSFNVDSALCYAAHHGGAPEQVLRDPMRIYHIEHGTGSGWTPQGQAQLFERLRANGIPWLEFRELAVWATQMRRSNAPMIFNPENWGLAGLALNEMSLPAGTSRQ